MKDFFKNALLVILCILMFSYFLNTNHENTTSQMDNNVVIVDSGNYVEEDDINEYETGNNIFSEIGSFFSSIFSKIAEFFSSFISKLLVNYNSYSLNLIIK